MRGPCSALTACSRTRRSQPRSKVRSCVPFTPSRGIRWHHRAAYAGTIPRNTLFLSPTNELIPFITLAPELPVDWLKKKDAAGNDLDPDALERAHKACLEAVTFSYVNVDSTEYVLFVVPAHLDATFVVHMPFSSNRYIPRFFHPSPTRSQRLCEQVPTPLFIIFSSHSHSLTTVV